MFFLSLVEIISAQSKDVKDLKTAYENYYEAAPETVYMHLNKTRFVQGEMVFFKAYLFDQKSLMPLKLNKNLFVGVYDSQGKQMQRTMWQINNGWSFGNIQIDSTFSHGSYYIKAFTHKMRNFDKRSGLLMKIDVLEYDSDENNDPDRYINLRLIPEGGKYIAEMINKIGFQAVDENGRSYVVEKGIVRDSSGKVMTEGIKSNAFGLGKFNLFLKNGETYHCEFELKTGHRILTKLFDFRDQGYMINISGGLENSRLISIRTNDDTLKKEKGKNLILAIHRDGKIKLISFKLTDSIKSFKVEKEKLMSGVNIISLLDEKFNVLTERILFNHHGLNRIQIESKIISGSSKTDSVGLELKSELGPSEGINLSVTISPEESVSNVEPISISNCIWFNTHLDPWAENSSYYFQSFDRKTLFDIDLLFLVHGKSNFTWSDLYRKIQMTESSENYGITLKGTIQNKKREKIESVLVFQDGIGMMQTFDVDTNGEFTLKNAPVIKGEMLKFLLMDEKGKTRKPEITLNSLNRIETDFVEIELSAPDQDQRQDDEIHEENLKRSFLNKRIKLDNIDLIVKPSEEEVNRNSNLTIGYWNAEKITAEDHKKYPKLSTYLRGLGFKVRLLGPSDLIFVDAKSLNPMVRPPIIYENGFRLFEPLRNYPLHNIDEIYYEHAGLRESNGGTIYIYTKQGETHEDSSLPFTNMMAKEGFEKPLYFKNPYESDDMDDMMRKYMNIHWEPILSRNDEGKLYLNFPSLGLKSFTVYIEGTTGNGKLFTESKLIKLED